jgi:hypothetical protein
MLRHVHIKEGTHKSRSDPKLENGIRQHNGPDVDHETYLTVNWG